MSLKVVNKCLANTCCCSQLQVPKSFLFKIYLAKPVRLPSFYLNKDTLPQLPKSSVYNLFDLKAFSKDLCLKDGFY